MFFILLQRAFPASPPNFYSAEYIFCRNYSVRRKILYIYIYIVDRRPTMCRDVTLVSYQSQQRTQMYYTVISARMVFKTLFKLIYKLFFEVINDNYTEIH